MGHPSSRRRSALSLACALFGAAPATGARRLVTRVGDPIPYRIDLPCGAEIETGPGLLAARTRELSIVVVATDMMAGDGDPLPVSEAGSRRILTSLVMGSDALLFALLDEELRSRRLTLAGVVRGIGTLGGQRAACVRGVFGTRGVRSWLDIHGTVKDGVLYMLAFAAAGGAPGPHERLSARIRESFTLPR
ncbi:MAG TPA: hypothetical protein VFT45_03945 [Longimicrobium sp.]|nr:hypothetical protein [Longimicrobium sp.]